MELPWWSYLGTGILISAISGYIYKFVPKNGSPNMSMAFFFFIGIIFIIIGVIKFSFRKAEVEQDKKYNAEMNKLNSQLERKAPNRVEQALGLAPQSEHTRQEHHASHNNNNSENINHTSGYAKTHPYHGIQKLQETNTNHPARTAHGSHHTQSMQQTHAHNQTQSATHSQTHEARTIINCKTCGTTNYSTSNYCHKCGKNLH